MTQKIATKPLNGNKANEKYQPVICIETEIRNLLETLHFYPRAVVGAESSAWL